MTQNVVPLACYLNLLPFVKRCNEILQGGITNAMDSRHLPRQSIDFSPPEIWSRLGAGILK